MTPPADVFRVFERGGRNIGTQFPEIGHQIAVFGRLGSRPFTRNEMERLFLKHDGRPYLVTDVPEPAARANAR